MDTTIKCAYANQLISADKWRGQLAIRNEEGVVLSDAKPAKYAYLTGSIMSTLYFNVMLENLSLFFYKCADPIYLLEYYSQ